MTPEEKAHAQFVRRLNKVLPLRLGRTPKDAPPTDLFRDRHYLYLLHRFLYFTRALWRTVDGQTTLRALRNSEVRCGPYYYLLHFGYIDSLTYCAFTGTAPLVALRLPQQFAAPDSEDPAHVARAAAFDVACQTAGFDRNHRSAVARAARSAARSRGERADRAKAEHTFARKPKHPFAATQPVVADS